MATITSPLAIKDTPERRVFQGFGYRVDISGHFLIVGTAINNAYIYKEVSPNNWVLHANLVPPEEDIFFGRAVSIEGDLAMVGAYGHGTYLLLLSFTLVMLRQSASMSFT